MPGECADWFFDNIITWSYCLHRRYSMSRQKNRMLINEHALNREPVPSSFTFLLNTHTLSTYVKNAGLFLPHASLLQVALTVVKLTRDWLFLRISKSICSEAIFAVFFSPWKKKNEFSLLIHLNSIKLAWRNRRHFATPPLVSSRIEVWETSAEIPYWWRITTQIWVVLLIGWGKFLTRHDQSETRPRSR